jgi:choline-glycine betaine transporter
MISCKQRLKKEILGQKIIFLYFPITLWWSDYGKKTIGPLKQQTTYRLLIFFKKK